MKPRDPRDFTGLMGILGLPPETPKGPLMYARGVQYVAGLHLAPRETDNVAPPCDPNIGPPPDAAPEWFNALQDARKQPKRQPAADVPLAALLALSFSTGACLGLLIAGIGL